MKKICHITSAHPPEDIRIFKKECVSLAKAGFDVYLVQRGESYDKEGVHIVGIGAVYGGRIKRFTYSSYKAYKLALGIDADLYHIHDPELLPYALLLSLKGKKVIFDSHEAYSYQINNKEYLPYFLRKTISKIYYFFESMICKKIEGVIACGYIDGQNTFESRSRRVEIIFNYPILNDFFPESTEGKNKDSFCYVGSISSDRGVYVLTQAASETNTRLVLAGNFSSEALRKEVVDLENIEYLGSVSQKEVRNIINESFCGACILRNVGQYACMEAFPIKVLEYLACAVPVVLNNNRFNTKFIEKYKVGLVVDPENQTEVNNAILYLRNNPVIAKQMGELGRRIVVDKYSWQSQANKLVNFYNQILKEG